jgi:hypothetical protein
VASVVTSVKGFGELDVESLHLHGEPPLSCYEC